MSQSVMTTQHLNEPSADGSWVSRHRVVLTLIMMALAVIACLDAWMDIVRIVQVDEEASHIMLVPLVFARIVWVRRGELKDWQSRTSLLGVVVALSGVALCLFGNIKAMQVVWHFGAILTVVGVFVSIQGFEIVRRLWPAFLVLLFLMPMPGVIRHPLALFLQNISAQLTEVVTIAMGFEVSRQGNLLIINDYPVGIAEACNGMRMVSMLILVVFAFVFSEKVRPWVRISLIVLAVPLAIICNIFRLVPTVLAYGFFSPDFADQLHDWLGWVMVVASYFMLMGLLWLMRWLLLPVDPLPSMRRRASFGSKRFSWASEDPEHEGHARNPWPLRGALAGLILVLSSAYAVGQSLPDGSEARAYHEQVLAASVDLPRQVGQWKAIDAELPEAAVALLRPNVLISRRYVDEATGRSFAMLIVQCADARDMEGHYPPNCYPSSGWTTVGQQSTQIEIADRQAAAVDYGFERMLQDGLDSIRVVNLMILPNEGFVTSMSSIRKLSGTVTDRYYGAAQMQFVFDSRWEKQDRHAVVEQVLTEMKSLINEILGNTGDDKALALP
ncbi:MAG: exosortase/archaeosortase family protein [Phycisphaeraceae bacterium]